MVSRKVRKESLKDSLKLNKERLAKLQDGECSEQPKIFKLSSRSTRESKFEDKDDEFDIGNSPNQRKEEGENDESAMNRKPLQRIKPKHTVEAKTTSLLEYLDDVRDSAESERRQILEDGVGATAFTRSRKYDWEMEVMEEGDETDSFFGGGPPFEVGGLNPIGDQAPPPPPTHDSPVTLTSGGSTARRSRSVYSNSTFAGQSSNSSRSKFVSTKLELEDKTKTIEALKRALDKARSEKTDLLKKSASESKHALDQQRDEHEKAVARHLGFIDKLLADKKHLAGKVEELSSRIRVSEETMAKKVRDLEEKHSKDLVRMKENLAAIDTAKRQKWQKEKSKELKELTIKGLEPEVQNILAKHREDLRLIEDKFKDETRALKSTHEKEKERTIQDLRARHEIDLEEMRTKERGSVASKLRQQEVRHQEEITMQRKRFEEEFEDIRKRHKEETKELQNQIQSRVSEATKLKEHELLEQQRRLEVQLESQEQKWSIEKEHWQSKLIKKMEEKAQAEEKRLKEKLTASRDKQIDAVISKLYAEQESKLAQLNDKHAQELSDVERRLRQIISDAEAKAEDWESKYNRLQEAHKTEKKTFSSAESRVRELELLAEKRESRIVNLSKKVASINDLLADKEREVRAEVAERANQYISENAKLQDHIEELREKLAKEAVAQKQKASEFQVQFEEETEEIHRRVRVTIARKDETIRALRARIEELEEKFEGYNELLEKQRAEFIG